MRKTILIILICGVGLLCGRLPAQTTNAPASGDLVADIGSLLGDVGISSNPTNYALATFGGKSMKGNMWAAGMVLAENVNQNVGVCIGWDTLGGGGRIGSANIVSGGLTLKTATHPLKFLSSATNSFFQTFTAIPYAVALVGSPLNGTGSADGGLAAINRVGFEFDVANISGWKIGLGCDYGNRLGSGNYNGNWIDVMLAVRKGF